MATPSSSLGRAIVLFRIGGIEIAFTPSWLLMVMLLSLVFRQTVLTHMDRLAGAAASVGLTLLFYLFVLLHEAAHTIVAASFGLQPRRIVLFLLGGVSQIGRDPEEPRHEYLVALAGPVVSLVIAGVFVVITRSRHESFDGVWGTLAVVNGALALFNLIPGFPLDGGRVFRASIWAMTGDRVRATRWAAIGGRVVGAGFVAGALGYMLWSAAGVGDAAGGVFYAILGWFLYSHAAYAGRQEIEREIIREQARREAIAVVPAQPPAGDIVPGDADLMTLPAEAATLIPEEKKTAKRAAKRVSGKSGEGNAAKSKASRGRGAPSNRSRSAGADGDQPRDGAGDSRGRSADPGGRARRRR